jgi:hypothetical protein
VPERPDALRLLNPNDPVALTAVDKHVAAVECGVTLTLWAATEDDPQMRRLLVSIAVFAAGASAVQSAAAQTAHGIVFGGNGPHGPYVVQINADGSVHASGDDGLTRATTQITPSQLAALDRRAARVHFGSFPAHTRCSGATKNTTTWIKVGSKEVTVAGTCLAAYQQLWKALVTATQFYASD